MGCVELQRAVWAAYAGAAPDAGSTYDTRAAPNAAASDPATAAAPTNDPGAACPAADQVFPPERRAGCAV